MRPTHYFQRRAIPEAPDAGLEQLLSIGLGPVAPPPGMRSLESRLLDRARRSAAAHRTHVTLRSAGYAWQNLAPGLDVQLLHDDEGATASLVRLAPGISVPSSDREGVQEVLVIQGDLVFDGTEINRLDYFVSGATAGPASMRSISGALFYRRHSSGPENAFSSIGPPRLVRAGNDGWEPLRRGVTIKTLATSGDRVSMLARLEPGVSMPTHSHRLGEECMMLEGDMFLDDVLLRTGDFQWAPAGTRHDTLDSDSGCLVFIHAAVDPSLVDSEYCRVAAG